MGEINVISWGEAVVGAAVGPQFFNKSILREEYYMYMSSSTRNTHPTPNARSMRANILDRF